jgi:hypothetical protein
LPVNTPRSFVPAANDTRNTVIMDTDMMDAGYDIDIDVGAGIEAPAPQPQQIIEARQAQGCFRAEADMK